MEYDPKTETLVFLAVKELGEATETELLQYMIEQEKIAIEAKILTRYLRRWKAKKIIAANYHDGQIVWKLADIPPWYMSGIMAISKGTTSAQMKLELQALDERLKTEGRIIQPRGVYGQYHTFELLFQTIDPILGGWVGKEERQLIFPRNGGGDLFIPMNWFHGWMRDNAALLDLPQSITYHIAWSNGRFTEQPKTTHKTVKVKTGLATYEAIPEGVQFKVIARVPFRGTILKSEEQLKSFFDALTVAPLRGLGAYPRAFGGRVELKTIMPL